MKFKIKYIISTTLLLLFTLGLSAQNCELDVSVELYDAYCPNGGRMVVTVNNAENFGKIGYGLKNSAGDVVAPVENSSNIIESLASGTYTLTVTAACKDDELEAPPRVRTIPNIQIKAGSTMDVFEVLPNQRNSIYNSLNARYTARIAYDISGGTEYYTITMLNKPGIYTGPTSFTVNEPGLFIMKDLAPGTYRFEIKDGCNNIATINETIGLVSEDVPTLSTLINTSKVYPDSKGSHPTERQKTISMSLVFVSNYNIHDYLTVNYRERSAEFYEFAYAYTTNASAIPDDAWRSFTISTSNQARYLFDGDYYYTQMYSPNNTSASGRVPYLYVRVKEAPSTVKRFDGSFSTFFDNAYSSKLSSTPNTDGLKVTLDAANGNQQYFLSLPYTLQATNGSETRSMTVDIPSDTSDYNSYKIDPYVILPYPSSGVKTWTIKVIPAAGGDPNINATINTVTVRAKSEYFSPIWSPSITSTSITDRCSSDSETIPNSFGFIGYGLVSGVPKVNGNVVTYPKIVKRFIPKAGQSLPTGTLTEVTSEFTSPGSHGISLLSNTNITSGYTLAQLAPGTYTWEIDLYGDVNDTQPSGTSTLNITISTTVPHAKFVDGAELKTYRVPLSGSECRGYKVMFKMSELRQLALKRNSPTQAYSRADVAIRLFKKSGTSWITTSEITPNNFTMSGGNLSSGYFLLSQLENNTNLSGKDPVFNITTDGEFVFLATVYYDSSVEYPAVSPAGKTSIPTNFTTNTCGLKNYFEIKTGYDNRTSIDADRTMAYRCSSTEEGELRINLMDTPAAGFFYTYKVTATNSSGAPTGVAIPNSSFTSGTQENVLPIPTGIEYVKVEVTYEQCVGYPSTYVLPVYDLTSPSIIRNNITEQCNASTNSLEIGTLELYAANIYNTSYQWYYPDGSPVESEYGGNTQKAIITANPKLVYGNYDCVLINPNCVNSPYRHTLTVTQGQLETLYWNPNANTATWASAANWLKADGTPAGRAPNACTDVVITGYFNNNKYPTASATAAVRDITFEYGAKLTRIQNLTYRSAAVEYNLGYYGDLAIEGASPTLNGSNILGITKAPSLKRSRWYGLAAPLKGVEFGDFQMGQQPYTFGARFNNATNNTSTRIFKVKNEAGDEEVSVTVLGSANQQLANMQNAFMFWVPKYVNTKGALQGVLNANKGKVVYPAKDKFVSFDMDTQSETDQARSSALSGRFVFDGALAGTVYTVTLPADVNRTSPYIMLGNPFMGPFRLAANSASSDSFYSLNKDYIENEFYIVNADGKLEEITRTYTNSESMQVKLAAPLQGFVIKLKDGLSVTDGFQFKFDAATTEVAQDGFANMTVE